MRIDHNQKNLQLATKIIIFIYFLYIIVKHKLQMVVRFDKLYPSEPWPIEIELEDALDYNGWFCLIC